MKLKKSIIDKATYEGDPEKNERCIVWDDEVKGFGLRIFPSGKKTFILSYRHNGRKRLMSIGAYGKLTVDEARGEAKKYHVNIIQGVDPLENANVNVQVVLSKIYASLIWSGTP